MRGAGARSAGQGTASAVAIAACIAAYTLVDDARIAHASPVVYLELVLAGPGACLRGRGARGEGRGAAVCAEARPPAAAAVLAMFGADALVLVWRRRCPRACVALAFAALRETSVVIAAALVAIFLGERVSRFRLAGAAPIAAGMVLLAGS